MRCRGLLVDIDWSAQVVRPCPSEAVAGEFCIRCTPFAPQMRALRRALVPNWEEVLRDEWFASAPPEKAPTRRFRELKDDGHRPPEVKAKGEKPKTVRVQQPADDQGGRKLPTRERAREILGVKTSR